MNLRRSTQTRTVGRLTSNGHDAAAWLTLDMPREDETRPHKRERRRRPPGTVLLLSAALLLLVLAVAQGYVSWRAQYGFIFAAKHTGLASALEALGLDTGAVIFALLGLAHARMGRPARIERILNVACALGSGAMNVLAADLGSPRSVAVYTLPAVLYACASDRLIATAAMPQASRKRRCGGGSVPACCTCCAPLWRHRPRSACACASGSLPSGTRSRAGQCPGAAAAHAGRAVSKKARLLELYAKHPDHGKRDRCPPWRPNWPHWRASSRVPPGPICTHTWTGVRHEQHRRRPGAEHPSSAAACCRSRHCGAAALWSAI